MPSTTLASSWHKFHWAQKHVQGLYDVLRWTFDPEAHPITVKVEVKEQGDRADAIIRVASLPAITTDCGLILGDTLQNYRAALDHLAWDLVQIGANAKPKDPKGVQFPMATNFKSFKGQLDRRLPGVPDTHRAIIRRYQPYGRGDAAKAMRWLRDLSDADKHRVMTPMVLSIGNINLTISSNWSLDTFNEVARRNDALYVGTEVVAASFTRTSPESCDVKVDSKTPAHPVLSRRGDLSTVLRMISGTVREVLTAFDELL